MADDTTLWDHLKPPEPLLDVDYFKIEMRSYLISKPTYFGTLFGLDEPQIPLTQWERIRIGLPGL